MQYNCCARVSYPVSAAIQHPTTPCLETLNLPSMSLHHTIYGSIQGHYSQTPLLLEDKGKDTVGLLETQTSA
jgi:hypothetical protein